MAPLALGDQGWYYRDCWPARPMVWLGEISYEIFLIHLVTMEFAMVYVVQAARLHRLDAVSVHRDAGGDDPAGLAAAPFHSRAQLTALRPNVGYPDLTTAPKEGKMGDDRTRRHHAAGRVRCSS